MPEEDALYKQAMSRIDVLVEEVLQLCESVAEENALEKDWVLDRFREKFNKAKRATRDK